ncbi:hypothetical protein LINPERHAP1_LOCUS30700, partial [Linum perenne]
HSPQNCRASTSVQCLRRSSGRRRLPILQSQSILPLTIIWALTVTPSSSNLEESSLPLNLAFPRSSTLLNICIFRANIFFWTSSRHSPFRRDSVNLN